MRVSTKCRYWCARQPDLLPGLPAHSTCPMMQSPRPLQCSAKTGCFRTWEATVLFGHSGGCRLPPPVSLQVGGWGQPAQLAPQQRRQALAAAASCCDGGSHSQLLRHLICMLSKRHRSTHTCRQAGLACMSAGPQWPHPNWTSVRRSQACVSVRFCVSLHGAVEMYSDQQRPKCTVCTGRWRPYIAKLTPNRMH